MSLTENESEDDMLSMDQVESPPTDDGHSEGNVNETVLKKGPWTSAEDAILVDYVKKHGEGNWNAVQKHSGLFRCGKSCRLRWANHLRPNLKKGAFNAEEERLIIELHAKMGNKWARMAAHLPGRTDNEIKNYWNTRIKRRQRAGLPLYPPEVRFQTLHDSQSQNSTGMNIVNEQNENSSFEIPDFICDRLKASQGILSYLPDIPSISAGSMLLKRTASCSSRYSSIPTMQQRKRIRQSMTPLYDFSASNRKRLPMIDPLQDFNQMAESFGLCIPFKPPDCYKSPLSFGAVQDNISISNGNHSASKPMFEAVKTELPSLQYPDTSFGSWEVPSPTPPLLEAAEELIQSPKQNGIVESRWPSPRNSGLLDALVYEAKALSNSRNNPNDKSSNSSRGTPFDLADCSALNLNETEWEDFVEPMSSYCSSTSVFSGSTPTSGDGILLDGHPITDAFPGCNVKLEPVDSIRMQDNEKEFPTAVDFPNPLFNSNWMEDKVFSEEQAVTNDPIAAFLHDDLMNDLKHNSSASCQGWGIGFYA